MHIHLICNSAKVGAYAYLLAVRGLYLISTACRGIVKCGKTFYGIISYADFIAVHLVDITGRVYFAVRYKYLKIGLLGKYRDMIFLRENFKPRNMV